MQGGVVSDPKYKAKSVFKGFILSKKYIKSKCCGFPDLISTGLYSFTFSSSNFQKSGINCSNSLIRCALESNLIGITQLKPSNNAIFYIFELKC